MNRARRAPAPPSSRPNRRRWHLLPPLIHGPEALEGGAILDEWPSERGVLLWQGFRDALLWVTAEPAARGLAFTRRRPPARERTPGDPDDERLERGLATLAALVLEPNRMQAPTIAAACRDLSEWAATKGTLRTALAFAQNAALATPDDAAAAFRVATLAVRINYQARAEVWFRRAIGLARRSHDWRRYAHGFSGLGNLYLRRGALPTARRLHLRALRAARRGGLRQERAFALHDLFAVAVEARDVTEAEALAQGALQAYGPGHSRVHVLAHDLAYFWTEQGQFARALPIFEGVLPLIDHPIEHLFVLANLTRAAAGAGEGARAREAAARIWSRLDDPAVERGIARALLEVARGMLTLHDTDAAERAARTALERAHLLRECKVEFEAEALLQQIAAAPLQPRPIAAEPIPASGPTDDPLATTFVRTLKTMAGAAH